uniref:Response regulator n=1 Tax=Panagrellus redivivus TaxID=6233 RepID=A0A7E4ZSY2_PANRE
MRKKRLIYVEDTLNLHCESIEICEKIIPFIIGPYSRLIISGNITWNQAKRLITANVKHVRIDARMQFKPKERSDFVNFVMKFCRGIVYK